MALNSVRPFAFALPALLACSLLAGCHVSSNKNGKNDNVDIGTPFGSMQVKTNDNVDGNSIGLSVYPGATVVKDDHDSGAADVDMNFGSFHLGVKAASYQTHDTPDKVVTFYRKDMTRYGDVIECQGHSSVGKPDRTSQGLTCDDEGGKHGNFNVNSDHDHELRAGSPQHQHIVAVESKNGGTHIGLVMLNLPSQIHMHDDKQSE